MSGCFPAEPDSVSPSNSKYSKPGGRAKKCIPRVFRLWMELQDNIHPEPPRDATENYPQSSRALQVFRLQQGPDVRDRRHTAHRDYDRTAGQRAAGLFGLPSAGARLRPSTSAAAIRVRAALGDRRLLSLPDASCELCHLWNQDRRGSLGRRQVPPDDELPLVPGTLGEAVVLEGSGLGLPHDLGERVSGRKIRGGMGH